MSRRQPAPPNTMTVFLRLESLNLTVCHLGCSPTREPGRFPTCTIHPFTCLDTVTS